MNAEAFESKEMTVNLGKTKLMVSGMEEEMFNSKIDLCGMCGIRVMFNSVLCTASRKRVNAPIRKQRTSRDQMKNCVMVRKLYARSLI